MGRPPLRRRAVARTAVVRSLSPSPAEALEPRILLAAHAAAAVARGPLAKLGTTLAAAAVTPATDAVAVDSYATKGKGAALARAERRLGATAVTVHGREVHALVPTSALVELAAVRSLRFARPDDLVTHAGAVTSQGDVADRAANARATYGITGSGVTVGILSDSFNDAGNADTYATDVVTGDLPAGVQVLADDPTAGTDEGRAMAQVIYDSAPGAKLIFATAEGGQATMAADIASLVKAGAKVIVDDVSYLAEPMFQDGVVAQAVAAAVAKGVSYFSAAGETGSNGFASTWASATPAPPVPPGTPATTATALPTAAGSVPSAPGAPAYYGGTAFNFATDGTSNAFNTFTLAAGQSVTLSFQWDSPYYSVSGGAGATNQLDAYVLNANKSQIVGGGVNYDVGGDPTQVFTYTNTTGASAQFNLALVTEAGSALPGYVKYVDFTPGSKQWTYGPDSGTVFGHANAAPAGAGLEAVGSANYAQTPAFGTTPAVLEPTSATGTTPIFFDISGNRLATPVVRQAPGLVAPDGVDTTFFGASDTDGDGHPNFFGTSAAAASAAGVAALVLSKVPKLSPASLDTALQSSALDMATPGVDSQTGYGLVQADGAIAAALNATTGTVTGTVYLDNNGNATLDAGDAGYSGGATVFVDANRNGVLDPGEVSVKTATDGTFALAGVPVGSDPIRVVVPNGTIATAASATIAVSAGATAAGVNLGLFSYVFSGTNGDDSYLLQVDAKKNANVDVTLGTTTYTVAKALLPALLFNPGAGNDTLNVSFVNGSPMPTGGVTYDGGTGTNALVVTGSTGADTITVKGQQTTVNNTPGIQAVDVASETINGNGGNDYVSETTPVAAGETLTFNGVGTTEFAIRDSLPNSGAGYVYNAGTTPTSSGTLSVEVGSYALAGDPALTSRNLTVSVLAGAQLILPAAAAGTGVNVRHLAGISVAAGGTMTVAAPPTHADRAVLVVANTVTVAGTGKLDLGGNDMDVESGSLSAAVGYAGGAWTGPGLDSSAAAKDTSHLTALGVIANTPAGTTKAIYGSANLFDGVVNPAAAAVLVKYTYYGDTNLDGVVSAGDYSRIDAAFITPNATGWANGDFDYDNVIDGSDYTLMDNAFNLQPTAL